jgi:hypothetical protein
MTPTNKPIKHHLSIPESYSNVSEEELYELYNHALIIDKTTDLKVKVNAVVGYEVEPSWALGTPHCREIASRLLLQKINKHNIQQVVAGNTREYSTMWAALAAAPKLHTAFLNMAETDEKLEQGFKPTEATGLYGHLDKNIPVWLIGGKLILARSYIQQIDLLQSVYGFKIAGVLTIFASLEGAGVNVMRTIQHLCETSEEAGLTNKGKFIYDYCIGIERNEIKPDDPDAPYAAFWTSNSIVYA